MNTKALAALGIVTAAVVGLAAWTIRTQRPITEETARGLLYDGLAAKLNDAAKITVTRAGKTFTIEKRDQGWILADKGGYPAQFDKVKAALLGIAELSIVEARTSSPDLYSRLGVEGAEKEGQGSTLVTIADASGKPLASFLLGKEETGSMDRVYVRRAGEPESWLVRTAAGTTRLDVPSDAMMWAVRDLPGVPQEQVKQVSTTHPDGESVVVSKEQKEDKNFAVAGIPAGRELKFPDSGNTVAGALAYMGFEDVQPVTGVDFDAKDDSGKPAATVARFETFDGMIVTATSVQKDGKTWVKFDAAYTPPVAPPPPKPPEAPAEDQPKADTPPGKSADDVKKDVEDFNKKAGGWAFQMAEARAKGFRTHMTDLLKDEKKPEPPAAIPPNDQAPVDYAPGEGAPGMPDDGG